MKTKTCKTLEFPRGVKVDIMNPPEDFEEQIRQSFADYTDGTNPDYMYEDKLAYIDLMREYAHQITDSYDAVRDLIFERFQYEFDEYGTFIGEEDFQTLDALREAYEAGKLDLHDKYTDDHHVNEKIHKLLARAIKVVMDYPETDDIDGDKVTRDDSLDHSDCRDSEEAGIPVEKPDNMGFHAETATEPKETGYARLSISMPADYFDEETLQNLKNLLAAKGSLIREALGVTETPIEVGEEKVSFPWFPYTPEDADTVKAYTHFIISICEMAKNQIRISPEEKQVEDPAYAFRCFLLRLGFVGDQYKGERKILLKNLTNSLAFRNRGANHAVSE